jgi:hypothetical protein
MSPIRSHPASLCLGAGFLWNFSAQFCERIPRTTRIKSFHGTERLTRLRRRPTRCNGDTFPPELSLGSKHLPWVPARVRESTIVPSEHADRAREAACARDASTSTSHGAGSSATARSQSADGRFATGRRHQAKRRQDANSEPSALSQRSCAVGKPSLLSGDTNRSPRTTLKVPPSACTFVWEGLWTSSGPMWSICMTRRWTKWM